MHVLSVVVHLGKYTFEWGLHNLKAMLRGYRMHRRARGSKEAKTEIVLAGLKMSIDSTKCAMHKLIDRAGRLFSTYSCTRVQPALKRCHWYNTALIRVPEREGSTNDDSVAWCALRRYFQIVQAKATNKIKVKNGGLKCMLASRGRATKTKRRQGKGRYWIHGQA